MTVATLSNKVVATGNGVATTYPFTFATLPSGDLVVTLFDLDGVAIPQAEPTNYSVLGEGSEDGGAVVFVVAPPADYAVLIQRIVPVLQPDDLKNQGSYYPRTVERMFDRRAMVEQQLTERIASSLALPPQVLGVSATLPSPSPLQPIIWNAAGNALDNGSTTLTGDMLLRPNLAQPTGSSLVGTAVTGAGAIPRTVEDKLREFAITPADFGAAGDGVTNDRPAIQAALDVVRLAGGGLLYFPPGTYIVDRSLLVGSNTIIFGAGDSTVIKASQAGYVGANTGVDATTNCQIFRNFNHSASSLTDSDILIKDLTIDWGSVTVSGGGAHCISMRYVDRPKVSNVRGINGENVTAFRACRDSLIADSHGINQINCFFDHWESSGNCIVRNCTGRSPDVFVSQGIQCNDTGDGSNTTAVDFLVEGCRLYRVRGASGQSTAIALSALDPGGFVFRARSVNNYVENADIGIVFGGGGGQHLSLGDTLRSVDQLPIFMQQNTASPGGCRVINPHLIDCNHAVVNQAMIVFNGSKNEVRGLKVTNTTAPAYACIARFTAASSNCVLQIDEAATGSSSRVIQGGTGNTVVDQLNEYFSASEWTPALNFGGANTGVAYTVQSGKITKIGQRVFWDLRLNLTSKGSSTGAATIDGLPYTAESASNIFYGLNAGTCANFSGANTNIEGYVNGNSIVLRNGGTGTQLTDANFTATTTMILSGNFSVA